MHRFSSPAQFEPFGNTAVAIGKFDAIHLGHRQILHELVQISHDQDLVPAVITFDRHPNQLLEPTQVPLEINSSAQRYEKLRDLGVEAVLTLEFNSELAALSPQEFVNRYLIAVSAKVVLVGEGFRFANKGEGDVAKLRELGVTAGFRVIEVPSVLLADRVVSSTLIRDLLAQGKVSAAGFLLGEPHSVRGVIEHGRKLGRTIGFPTANFSRLSEGMLPQDGVYAGYLEVDGNLYPAAHSVGTNDSVAEVPRLLESHVMGRDDLNLYDKVCTATFIEQVRPWSKFASLELLIEQIAKDVQDCREILEGLES